jgi:hypothetical protein
MPTHLAALSTLAANAVEVTIEVMGIGRDDLESSTADVATIQVRRRPANADVRIARVAARWLSWRR